VIFLVIYFCPRCGRSFNETSRPVSCDCGTPLKSTVDWADLEIDPGARGMARYSSALPPLDPSVSMGEGWTPLVRSRSGGPYYKLEYLFPTGSFKDRGSVLVMTEAKNQGQESVVQDSSGNAGASIAAYAARCGIRATVIVPRDTAEAKRWQIELYGATLEIVDGDRAAAALVAFSLSGSTYYASHVWNPLFLEGTKTVAFEIWEQLGFRAPDAVVVPAGNGTMLLGVFKGFRELLQRARVRRMPRIYAAQGTQCAPLYAEWNRTEEKTFRATIAEGIAVTAPPRMREMIDALRASRGDVITVDDQDILAEQERLALEEGLLVEPTAAAAPAAERALRAAGVITAEDTVVVPLTGSGLKKVPPRRPKKQASPDEERPLFETRAKRVGSPVMPGRATGLRR